MARISVHEAGGRYTVIVDGPLKATDLRRLERACGPALEMRSSPLEIRLHGVIEIDAAAEAYLGRLQVRGARVHVGPADDRGD